MGRFTRGTGKAARRHRRGRTLGSVSRARGRPDDAGHVFWCSEAIGRSVAEDATAFVTQTTVLDLSASEELCAEPGALEQVRRAYARLAPGDRLEVHSPIAEHAFAVRAWSRKNGVSVIVDEPSEGFRRLVLEAPAANG
jgi:hypothetical protein